MISSTTSLLQDYHILEYNDFAVAEAINYRGSGGFSAVCTPGTLSGIDGPEIVALKILFRRSSQSTDEWWKLLYREGHIWNRLAAGNHPNVLPFLGLSLKPSSAPEEPAATGLVMPWLKDGDVSDYLHHNSKSWQEKLRIVCDIAKGLAYMHSVGVIHGDMKPKNVLIDGNGAAVICDFGLSRLTNGHTGLSVSIYGLDQRRHAPELVFEDEATFSKASDVWAFACTAYEIFTGQVPYYRFPKLRKRWFDALESGLTPEWNDKDGNPLCDIPSDLRDWIDKRWASNPGERGDMEALAAELEIYVSDISI